MHSPQFEISKPTDDSTFEDMCARIYGEVFQDRLPKINGRRGQQQGGIDVFVNSSAGRIGIQCKRYQDGRLKFSHVEAELRKADDAGSPIVRLIFATTAASDAGLLRQVQDFSDARLKAGLYPVEIEFWDDICRHIRGSGRLQNDYAPNAPGAAFDRMDQAHLNLYERLDKVQASFELRTALPNGRADSINTYLTSQLDVINDLLKLCKFRDAHESLIRLGKDLNIFDPHQCARWYLMRGVCTWHLDTGKAASADFLKAYELFPSDEKIAAAGVRGLLLQGDVAGAIKIGSEALDSFPSSVYVWTALANAQMMRGDNLSLSNVPLAMRQSCDVLHLLAYARWNVGDLEGAIELSGRAIALPDADFFVRATALGIALEAASEDPVKIAYGCVGDREIAALEKSVSALRPRTERVWSIQTQLLQDTLIHLGYAAIVLGQAEDALVLVNEAKHAGCLSPGLMRIALEAYRHLDRPDDLVRFGREWLSQLDEEALVLVAQTASGIGNIELVEATWQAVHTLVPKQRETLPLITAMRWIALWQSPNGRELALEEALKANLSQSDSLGLISGGARILFAAGRDSECEVAIQQACRLVDTTASSAVRLLLADLLYATKNYARAIPLYESLVVRGRISELHGRLLFCYIETHARRKGLELLMSFPDGWTEDDRVRELAIQLGHLSADWSFLEPLAEKQCEKAPEVAGAWLLQLTLFLRTKKMHRFHQTLLGVPSELKGSHRQIANLAALELRYGDATRGVRRLYRLFRIHMDELEAASAYFVSIINARDTLPDMDESVDTVAPGTTVELQEEHGGSLIVSIDPNGTAPLPARTGFFSADAENIVPLLGLRVGASVDLPSPLNMQRKYTVRSITSVHRQLLKVAQQQIQASMSAQGTVLSVPIPQTSMGPDFSQMQLMLQQKRRHTQHVLDTYSTTPMPLGILAMLLGCNVVDIPGSWGAEYPPLFVGHATLEEQFRSAQLLERPGAVYVTDAVTIAELVHVNGDRALEGLPKVLLSSQAMELLEAKLEQAKSDLSAGQLIDHNGLMRFVESTPESKAKQLALCEKMVEVAHRYCDIVPVYGPVDMPPELEQLHNVLQKEEYSALLLAAEHQATLLTLDGHLAQLATTGLNLTRVWPQAVMRYAADKRILSEVEYNLATVKQFLWNRSFISISAHDLVFLCFQGGFVLRTGLHKFKDYLSSPGTDFQSVVRVMFEFLKLQSKLFTQFKAFTELVSHLVEALLRHPACSKESFMLRVVIFLRKLMITAAGPKSPFPDQKKERSQRISIQMKLLFRALQNAEKLATNPPKPRAIKLKSIMGPAIPMLAYDGTVSTSYEMDTKVAVASSRLEEAHSLEKSVVADQSRVGTPNFTAGAT